MGFFKNKRLWKKMMVCVILILPIIFSCSNEYTTQHFSFPPGSMPSENNWEYTALTIVSSKQKPITKKSKKNVRIKIYDKNKTIFLNDTFKFVSASIRTNVEWKEFKEIRIKLFEVGNKFSEDTYNKNLLKSGPNSLLELTYQYDQESKQFKRVN
ncbi:MAG: hypothetical protein KKE44_24965 [Proteobacteria bacterium]|nr:hypothetical protein [Pseudomonadota bacterium]MBU1585982.1 hypothetical protein [Pseudomonadota bacterium]MBU2453481.1 hypothetical protein [Pseudomonadota bacterium]